MKSEKKKYINEYELMTSFNMKLMVRRLKIDFSILYARLCKISKLNPKKEKYFHKLLILSMMFRSKNIWCLAHSASRPASSPGYPCPLDKSPEKLRLKCRYFLEGWMLNFTY